MIPTAIRMIPRIPAGFMETGGLQRTASRNQIDDQDDDSDDQDQVDERAAEMTDETEEPENQENNEDSPEHMFSFRLIYVASRAGARPRLKIFENPSLARTGAGLAGQGE